MAIDIFYTFFVLQSMLALAHCAVVNQGDADQHLIKLNRIKTKTDERTQQKAVEGLISRLIPSKKDQIIVKIDTKFSVKGHDKFSVFSDGDHVTIIGNTGVSASWGLHHYLKYYCWCHVSWSGVQLNVPVKWPKANITVASNDRFRYYQNVCTASYSTVWWNWTRWEKEIDWMALNGMNLPLSFTGQEEIFRRLYTLYRIPELDFEEFFTGPAFLAWNRMGNIQSWAGPLPSSWYDQRLKLQHRILKRMREFGMTPVLPGFSGHVPLAMQKMFPSAKIHRLKSWGKFTFPYTNVSFLEPSDPLFQVMGSAFINIMTKEFGTDHIYNVDLFNEMDPPSGSLEYLREASNGVFVSMTVQDPDAIWLTQAWMFYHDQTFWTPPRVKAFVSGVPLGGMLLLDLSAELHPQYGRLDSFYGQPFIWCMLHNYGGVLGMFGAVDDVNDGTFVARKFQNSTMVGTGLTMEGINQNYVMYDFMNEMSWRDKPVGDLDSWFGEYSHRRYGAKNGSLKSAWKLLKRSVYNCTTRMRNHGHYVMVQRPRLNRKPLIWYDANDVFDAWKYLLEASDKSLEDSETFSYDLVDVTRQSLQIIFASKYVDLVSAFKDKDLQKMRRFANEILEILNDVDDILKTNSHYLLGVWIADAKNVSSKSSEKSVYDGNARNQITLWGPDGEILDYAVKQWSGVVRDYFHPRWKLFAGALIRCAESSKPFPEKRFEREVFERVELPFSTSNKTYPTTTEGVTRIVSKKLFDKYKPKFNSIVGKMSRS